MSRETGSDRVIGGMKLTHDGAVALVRGNRLEWCIEAEKVANSPRYSALDDLSRVEALLATEGVSMSDLDTVVVDGWVRYSDGTPVVSVRAGDVEHDLPVASYHERRLDDVASPVHTVNGVLPTSPGVPYRSYFHAVGHVFAAYCTSPFALEGEPALVLVWDGGMTAALYGFDPTTRRLVSHGSVLGISGSVYPTFAAQLEPFAWASGGATPEDYLPVSGKAMAYAALGTVDDDAVATLHALLAKHGGTIGRRSAPAWAAEAVGELGSRGLSAADILAAFQQFLGDALIGALRDTVARLGLKAPGLCFTGGCALNIKWNGRLRGSGLFRDVWVPPFPNDSGSAIGAACAEMVASGEPVWLDWDVFSGPRLGPATGAPAGWSARPLDIEGVAALLATEGEPVVMLHGRAELGPRALGHRSIVAPAVDRSMHDRLNAAKGRESYRPVAPICLESRAAEVFSPGGRDPYMLFDHDVRPEWADRIPAVVHVDGSARLQTVSPADDLTTADLLRHYESRTGVPVLCNTSANHSGRGFFPDVASAAEWGRARYIWSDGTLYERSH